MDSDSLQLLESGLRSTMTTASGPDLDTALTDLGWLDMLDEMPTAAIPLVFRLLGETGAHAPILNDVVLRAAGRAGGSTVPLPMAGDRWVVWERGGPAGTALGGELPLRVVAQGDSVSVADGRQAIGWWLVGAGHAMLALARRHALDRSQFGRPVASFQAVRHRLAETLAALEGAEATLEAAAIEPCDLSALMAKAAAGQAALTAARHCQQVLGGIGFTAEHDFHRHVERVYVLDALLGSSRELTREAGAALRDRGAAPRLVQL